jgi:hypothetical protein
MAGSRYEIRVRGLIDDSVLNELNNLQASTSSTSTILTGVLHDQAALIGLLARLKARGLTVLDIRRDPDPPAAPE